MEITVGDVMRTASDAYWVLPTSTEPRRDLIDPEALVSFLANENKIVDLGGYVLSVTGYEDVAVLDPSISSDTPFDIYVAKPGLRRRQL